LPEAAYFSFAFLDFLPLLLSQPCEGDATTQHLYVVHPTNLQYSVEYLQSQD